MVRSLVGLEPVKDAILWFPSRSSTSSGGAPVEAAGMAADAVTGAGADVEDAENANPVLGRAPPSADGAPSD